MDNCRCQKLKHDVSIIQAYQKKSLLETDVSKTDQKKSLLLIDVSRKLLKYWPGIEYDDDEQKIIINDTDFINKYGPGIYGTDELNVKFTDLVPLLQKNSLFEKTEEYLKFNTNEELISNIKYIGNSLIEKFSKFKCQREIKVDIKYPIIDDKLIVQYSKKFLCSNLQDGPFILSFSVERLIKYEYLNKIPMVVTIEIKVELI